ncbi:hypothetical protein GCM10029992_30480 [Glycomyces albus]
MSSDGTVIALSGKTGVHYLDTTKMPLVESFDTGYSGASDMRLSADGSMLAITGAEGTRVWRFDGAELGSEPLFDEPDLVGRQVQFHPDGTAILIAEVGTFRMYDLASGEELDMVWEGDDWTAHVGFSPDGRWLTVFDGENLSGEGYVKFELDQYATLFDAETGEEHMVVDNDHTELALLGGEPVGFSADGELLATRIEQRLILWSLTDGTKAAEVSSGFTFGAPVLSADGSRIVASGIDMPMVWDWETDALRIMDEPDSNGLFESGQGFGTTVSLTADGRYVLRYGGTDGGTLIWSADTGAYLTQVSEVGEDFRARHLPGAGAVFGLDEHGIVHRYDLGFLDDPYAALCERTDRSLTEDEWAEYLPGIDRGSIEIC